MRETFIRQDKDYNNNTRKVVVLETNCRWRYLGCAAKGRSITEKTVMCVNKRFVGGRRKECKLFICRDNV